MLRSLDWAPSPFPLLKGTSQAGETDDVGGYIRKQRWGLGDGDRLPPNTYRAHFHPRLKCSSKEGRKERSDGEEEGATGGNGKKSRESKEQGGKPRNWEKKMGREEKRKLKSRKRQRKPRMVSLMLRAVGRC